MQIKLDGGISIKQQKLGKWVFQLLSKTPNLWVLNLPGSKAPDPEDLQNYGGSRRASRSCHRSAEFDHRAAHEELVVPGLGAGTDVADVADQCYIGIF